MHIPVLLNEVLEVLKPQRGGIFLDCTFGAGGYTRGILENSDAKVVALDRDETVLPTAEKFKAEFGERFEFVQTDFGSMQNVLSAKDYLFDGIVFDIGVSSMQIDNAERGFSFYQDGDLDMRMSKSISITAAEIVNTYKEADLADIFYHYGDEKKSRFIAKRIVEQRSIQPFNKTLELANFIKALIPKYNDTIHPATRVFQALRIVVNDELNQLQNGLIQAKSSLRCGGVLAVVTFHSGEDVIVKKFFNELTGNISHPNRHLPSAIFESKSKSEFEFAHRGTVIANNKELKANPRARSAKLRAVRKLI